jgi:hypothetical protein
LQEFEEPDKGNVAQATKAQPQNNFNNDTLANHSDPISPITHHVATARIDWSLSRRACEW